MGSRLQFLNPAQIGIGLDCFTDTTFALLAFA
jgi:hypothetical protein